MEIPGMELNEGVVDGSSVTPSSRVEVCLGADPLDGLSLIHI